MKLCPGVELADFDGGAFWLLKLLSCTGVVWLEDGRGPLTGVEWVEVGGCFVGLRVGLLSGLAE